MRTPSSGLLGKRPERPSTCRLNWRNALSTRWASSSPFTSLPGRQERRKSSYRCDAKQSLAQGFTLPLASIHNDFAFALQIPNPRVSFTRAIDLSTNGNVSAVYRNPWVLIRIVGIDKCVLQSHLFALSINKGTR